MEIDVAAFACRLCRAMNAQHLFTVNNCRIVRCGGCGLVQLDRRLMPEDLDNLYSEKFFQKIKYFMDSAARSEQARRWAWLRQSGVAPDSRILDAGCAAGDFLVSAPEGFEMWGIDFSAHAVEAARQRLPSIAGRLHPSTFEALDFEDGFFDAITVWDVVEHLDDPVSDIGNLVRKLRPGGTMLLSSPNAGAPIARVMGKRWAFMHPLEHVCFYCRQTLTRLVTDCGLRVHGWRTSGKMINLGFLVYKFGRVFPEFTPRAFVAWLAGNPIGRIPLYIPTGDIQYLAARKPD